MGARHLHCGSMSNVSPLPPELLHAVAERGGRIALVVGAGCSLEHPTNLLLAGAYAERAHRQLVADGVLGGTDCANPSDLSAVASAVVAKVGLQAPLVRCLPRNDFRMALPNAGYLIAAALLREGVIEAVLTLNFDVALTTALGTLGGTDVHVVTGPDAVGELGGATVIYLHRSVEETNPERWILTTEALQKAWQNGWEEVVARRVMSCPLVVFAGLGSPAAVLTETVTRVRAALTEDQHHVFVVDPASTTQFEAALNLPPEAHLHTSWCAFMEQLADRLIVELSSGLTEAGNQLCAVNNWVDEAPHLQELSNRLHSLGLVHLGMVKARWLLESRPYVPDDVRRLLIADLLLGVGLIERALDLQARIREDGVVELQRGAAVSGSFLAVSGAGTLRWSALEAKVLQHIQRIGSNQRPDGVLVGGVVGCASAETTPPEDLIGGETTDDIVDGFDRPILLSVDDIRKQPDIAARMVA